MPLAALALLCFGGVTGIARGQQDAPPAESAESSRARIRELRPSIIYAPDAEGELRPVINLPLERIDALLGQQPNAASLEQSQPSYVLEMTADGRAHEGGARLQAEFAVRLNRTDWVRVPLRLDECLIVPGSVSYEGPGEHLLVPNEQGEGYVCWLRGQGDEPHRLGVELLAGIEAVGDEFRLRISTPMATSTVVSVAVPGADLVGRVPEGAMLETTINDDGPSTIFKVICSRGPVDLAWWKRSIREQVLPSLEATGAIFAEISGNSVEETATLSVRSFDQPFDRFRIRLPEGAILKSGGGANYAVIETSTAGESEEDPSGWIYEVQLDRSVRQADVRLLSERTDIPEGAPIQLAGFELLEARRQAGHLAVSVTGDWQVLWGEDLNVHRVTEAELPAELRGKPIVAAFAYVAQPSSLHARVVQRKARRVAESSLVLQVDRGRERLDAQFKFVVTGARVSTLELNWPDDGWTIDDVGPPSLVDVRQLNLAERAPLVIPLLQPSQGELELTVKATRRRASESERIDFHPPAPVAELLRPSLLAVAAADNVRVRPSTDSLQGLTRQSAVFLKNLPNLQQEPQCYRIEQVQARFVADVEVVPGSVAVDGNVSASFDGNTWLVDHRFTFDVRNEPLSSVSFDLPSVLVRSEQLAVQIDGQPVRGGTLTLSEPTTGSPQLRVDLASPRIGSFTVSLAYPIATSIDQTQLAIPLATPREGAIRRTQAYVTAGEAAELELTSPTLWQPVNLAIASKSNSGLLVESRQPVQQLGFALRRVATVLSEPLVVERCWMQSLPTATECRERAVFRVSTSRPRLEIQLPPATKIDTIQTWLNGQLTTSRLREGQTLVIALPPASGVQQHVIELSYSKTSSPARLYRPNLDPPTMLAAGSPCLTYWELILPDDRLMLLQPVDFHPEMRWVWNRIYWHRQPALNQLELEMWSGGRRETASAGGGNRYLFSVLGAPGSLSPLLFDRSSLILLASGTVLAVGLLLLQVPVLRHPALLLVLATIVISMSLLRFDAALLMAQAAGLGVVLLVVALVLKWSLSARRESVVVVRRSPSSIVERGSKRGETPALMQPAGSNSSTKTTVPIEMASESKS